MTATPVWEQRFQASDVTFPSWSRLRPDRVVYASSETGAYQVYAHDLASSLRRRVTDVAIGNRQGIVHPDGESVLWFDDPRGDEVGRWMREPFEGGAAEPLLDGVPDAWPSGLALGLEVIAVGIATADEYSVHACRGTSATRVLYRASTVAEVVALDRAEQWIAITHGEHGDSMHLAVRVLAVDSGETVGDLWDGEGKALGVVGFAPPPGDARLLLTSELHGPLRPTVWDVATGERRDYALPEFAGDAIALGWWPDASAALVGHSVRGRSDLWRLDLASGEATRLDAPAGHIEDGRVRPDGGVWFRHSSGSQPPTVRAVGSADEMVAPEGPRAPEGHPYEPWSFRNERGDTVHGFLVQPPDAPAPHPTVVLVHGGPHHLWADAWRPEVSAWVDHGWAVALVNYRGSTGHGAQWRDQLVGNPGFPELEDEIAGLDDLIASGVTDPARVVVSGGSWGGYIALLAAGLHPKRWVAAIGVVPVADYVAAFEDEAPALQAMDRDLFGGDPSTARELYEERSPITYVDRVASPVLIIAGDNDTRCPIRQVHNYVGRLSELGIDHHLDVFEAGHGSMVAAERVRHMRLEIDFLADRGLLAR